jgi:hypothetical protein
MPEICLGIPTVDGLSLNLEGTMLMLMSSGSSSIAIIAIIVIIIIYYYILYNYILRFDFPLDMTSPVGTSPKETSIAWRPVSRVSTQQGIDDLRR